MKKCIRCYLKKELSEYYKHPQTVDGYLNKCKECCKGYARENRSVEYDRGRYKNNMRRRLYCTRIGMKARCYKTDHHHYKRYGAKGIIIEWKTFDEFHDDMIESYVSHGKEFGLDRKGTQLDRINGAGNYSKENCRRVTAKENCNNRINKV